MHKELREAMQKLEALGRIKASLESLTLKLPAFGRGIRPVNVSFDVSGQVSIQCLGECTRYGGPPGITLPSATMLKIARHIVSVLNGDVGE